MLGLEACTALEEVYLSHNGIWRLEVRGGGGGRQDSMQKQGYM